MTCHLAERIATLGPGIEVTDHLATGQSMEARRYEYTERVRANPGWVRKLNF